MERVRQIERTCAGAASGVFARGGRGGGGHGCVTFGTSIWDESLFKAWSQIVQMLLPNASHVGLALNRLADALDADELILFEKSTFLVRSSTRTRLINLHIGFLSDEVQEFSRWRVLRCTVTSICFFLHLPSSYSRDPDASARMLESAEALCALSASLFWTLLFSH